MRGNPLVNLAAILVMLASVLVGGGGYWLISKKEESMKVFERPEKIDKKPLKFEKAHKRTE